MSFQLWTWRRCKHNDINKSSRTESCFNSGRSGARYLAKINSCFFLFVFFSAGLKSWLSLSWLNQFSPTLDKTTVSSQLENTEATSVLPVETTREDLDQSMTTAAADWSVVTEVLQLGSMTPDMDKEPVPSVLSIKEDEVIKEKSIALPQEGFGEERKTEEEGSSWGDVDLSESTTKTTTTGQVLTSTYPSIKGTKASTTHQVEDITAAEARGEIEYEPRTAASQPDPETTTVFVSTTSGGSESEERTETTAIPNLPMSSSQSLTERGVISPTASDEDHLSIFATLLPGNPESGRENSDADRNNGSEGMAGCLSASLFSFSFQLDLDLPKMAELMGRSVSARVQDHHIIDD